MVDGQLSDFSHYQKSVGIADGLMEDNAIVDGIIEKMESEDE